MKNQNFTLVDIRKILRKAFTDLFWTGKVYDEVICDYKDLTIEDFENDSMHSFLFIDGESCFSERDIQISDSNFKIYEDSDLSPVDKDLSNEWITLLTKNKKSNNV